MDSNSRVESIISSNLREDFFIKLYFDTDNGYYNAGIKRAFLDFSRTLKIKDDNRAKLRKGAEEYLYAKLNKATQIEFRTQTEFDAFHKMNCEELINIWDELTFGQAQKWINMTLKYWLLFGDKRIKGIDKNARFFHIPIDSFVQKGMFNEKRPDAWSKIDNYQTYFNYQELHRNKKTGNYPLVDEFIFFNSYRRL